MTKTLPTFVARPFGADAASIGWVDDAARYHVWVDQNSAGVWEARRNMAGRATLYKNPPLGTQPRGPDYFETRWLDAESAANGHILAAALEFANGGAVETQRKADQEAAEQLAREVNDAHAAAMREKLRTFAASIKTGDTMRDSTNRENLLGLASGLNVEQLNALSRLIAVG